MRKIREKKKKKKEKRGCKDNFLFLLTRRHHTASCPTFRAQIVLGFLIVPVCRFSVFPTAQRLTQLISVPSDRLRENTCKGRRQNRRGHPSPMTNSDVIC